MSRILSRLRTLVPVATLALALAACGDDILQPTFGAQCAVGALSTGDERSVSFRRDACIADYHFWSGNTVRYVSYDVTLTKGKGYHLFSGGIPDDSGYNEVQTIMALHGRGPDGQSLPLAVASGDAGGPRNDTELFFIAPKSGTYSLVIATYNSAQRGDVRVAMEQCPVVATLDTAGTYDLAFESTPCVRRNMAYGGFPSRVVLVGVKAEALSSHEVTVTASDVTPTIEMGGPDFDVYSYLYDGSDYSSASGQGGSVSLEAGNGLGGMYTLAVGATSFDPSGSFTLALDRQPLLLMKAETASARGRRNLGWARPTLR